MLYRFTLDLAIPSGVFDSISATQKQAFGDTIRKLKSYAVKINEGLRNEEMTVVAKWHKCYHDNPDDPNFKPCNETEQDI